MSKIYLEEIFGIPIEDVSHIYGIPVSQLLKMYEALLSSSSSSSSSMSYSSSSSSSSISVAPLAWDFGVTPDTIDPGGNITIGVEGGRAPYTWSILSGVGYSIDAVTDPTNTLEVVGGVCGVNYDAVVQVQVEDDAGIIITRYFRNTGGKWTLVDSCIARQPGVPGDPCHYPGCTNESSGFLPHYDIAEDNITRYGYIQEIVVCPGDGTICVQWWNPEGGACDFTPSKDVNYIFGTHACFGFWGCASNGDVFTIDVNKYNWTC